MIEKKNFTPEEKKKDITPTPTDSEKTQNNTSVEEKKDDYAEQLKTIVSPLKTKNMTLEVFPSFSTGIAKKGTDLYDEAKEIIDHLFIEMYGFVSGTKGKELLYLQFLNKTVGGIGVKKIEDNMPKILPEILLTEKENEPLIKDFFDSRSNYVEFGSAGVLKEHRKQGVPLLFLNSMKRGIELGATKGIGIFNILILRLTRSMGLEMKHLAPASLESKKTQDMLKLELNINDETMQEWHKRYFGRLSPEIITIDLQQARDAIAHFIKVNLNSST